MTGPLTGTRVLELAGMGPGPHAAMLLTDLGADVVRVQRPGTPQEQPGNQLLRGRRYIEADLISPEDREAVLGIAANADSGAR